MAPNQPPRRRNPSWTLTKTGSGQRTPFDECQLSPAPQEFDKTPRQVSTFLEACNTREPPTHAPPPQQPPSFAEAFGSTMPPAERNTKTSEPIYDGRLYALVVCGKREGRINETKIRTLTSMRSRKANEVQDTQDTKSPMESLSQKLSYTTVWYWMLMFSQDVSSPASVRMVHRSKRV